MEIDELGDGDIFGDYSLLYECDSECSYITSIPTEVLAISAYDFKSILDEDTMEIYKRSLKMYPSEEEIDEIYNENEEWRKYKSKLVKNIVIDKQNKKGFDKRLRLPSLKPLINKTPINLMDIKSSDN